jgi:hypothetical protein
MNTAATPSSSATPSLRSKVLKGVGVVVALAVLLPVVNSLKGVSSRLMRKEFGDFHPWLKRRGVLWSPSYFAASCGSAPIEILRQYVEQQQAVPA